MNAGDDFIYCSSARSSSSIRPCVCPNASEASCTVLSASSAECGEFAKSEKTFLRPSAKIFSFPISVSRFSFAVFIAPSEKPASLSFASSVLTMSSVIAASSFCIRPRSESSSSIPRFASSERRSFSVIRLPASVIFFSNDVIFSAMPSSCFAFSCSDASCSPISSSRLSIRSSTDFLCASSAAIFSFISRARLLYWFTRSSFPFFSF